MTAEGRRPSGRIAFARIEPETLGASELPEDQLIAALVPGTRIERHGREWRMGRWSWEGESIVGRIGFQSEGLTELFNEATKDFYDETRPLGLTSPFAIDPDRLRVAFQVRGRDIKVKSFTGALQALLNAASPTERWRVRHEIVELSFREWAGSVDRIVLLRMVAERPNPHYGDRARIRAIVEGTNAQLAEVRLRADPEDPQGLDIDDPLINEFIDHAAEHYGKFSAVGDSAGDQAAWDSAQRGATEIHRVGVDPITREARPVELRRELGDPTAEQEELEDARALLDAEADREMEELLEELEEDDDDR